MSLYRESPIVQATTKNVRKFANTAHDFQVLQSTLASYKRQTESSPVYVWLEFIKYVHELRFKTQNSLSNWHIQFSMEVLDLETPGVGKLWAGFENSYIASLMCSNGK